ncbi:hypothetical protein TCSYLVIO_010686 [Trypanosoma cruzi]|nr:hypothetical protein TCSYLVIO_010686 [Trypanosoma cruzi]KAF8276385.1 putative exonuclease [Trypanosoma cruzi]RNF23575.1 exonuclease [Trypanosoma cruzi]
MQSARTRDLAAEVALIRKELRPLPESALDGTDDGVEDDGGGALLHGTGTRFEILMRGAKRRTAARSAGTSDAFDRHNGSSSQSKKRLVPQIFSHLLVCDFEATCDSASVAYPHEIIEFPVVCVDTAELRVVAEFHSYVRPTKNSRLTSFCTALTGITQAQVDAAPRLPEVLRHFDLWLREVVYPLCRRWRKEHLEGLNKCLKASQKRRFVYDETHNPGWIDCERMICMVTDGPWDMRKFMYECSVVRDGHLFPPLFYRWVNVRHSFAEHFRMRPRKLNDMLRKLGLSFHGHPHSGIDDSRNIARIVIELLKRGYRVHHVSTINYENAAAATAMAQLLGESDEDGTKPPHQRAEGRKKGRKNPTTTTAARRRGEKGHQAQ